MLPDNFKNSCSTRKYYFIHLQQKSFTRIVEVKLNNLFKKNFQLIIENTSLVVFIDFIRISCKLCPIRFSWLITHTLKSFQNNPKDLCGDTIRQVLIVTSNCKLFSWWFGSLLFVTELYFFSTASKQGKDYRLITW